MIKQLHRRVSSFVGPSYQRFTLSSLGQLGATCAVNTALFSIALFAWALFKQGLLEGSIVVVLYYIIFGSLLVSFVVFGCRIHFLFSFFVFGCPFHLSFYFAVFICRFNWSFSVVSPLKLIPEDKVTRVTGVKGVKHESRLEDADDPLWCLETKTTPS